MSIIDIEEQRQEEDQGTAVSGETEEGDDYDEDDDQNSGHLAKDGKYYSTYMEMVQANRRHNEQHLKDSGLLTLVKKKKKTTRQHQTSTPNKKRRRPSLEEASEPLRRSKRVPIPVVTLAKEQRDEKEDHKKTTPPPPRSSPRLLEPKPRRKGPSKKQVSAQEEEKLRRLHAKYQDQMKADHAWWDDFQAFWKGQLSDTNFKTICRQVAKLASGQGIEYKHWPAGVVFPPAANGTTPAVGLASDFAALYEEATAYEDRYGKDKGHGWLVKIPLKKMARFQRYYLEKQELLAQGNTDDSLELGRLQPQIHALGTRLRKRFPQGWFQGTLNSYDGELYHVIYEDGDYEELDHDDLANKELVQIICAPSSDLTSSYHKASHETVEALSKFPVGTPLKKEFPGHGVFRGEVISYTEPYYKIQYSDGDKEDMTEAQLSKLVKQFNSPKKKRGRPRKNITTVDPPTIITQESNSSGNDTQTTVMECVDKEQEETGLGGVLGTLMTEPVGEVVIADDNDSSDDVVVAASGNVVDTFPPLMSEGGGEVDGLETKGKVENRGALEDDNDDDDNPADNLQALVDDDLDSFDSLVDPDDPEKNDFDLGLEI